MSVLHQAIAVRSQTAPDTDRGHDSLDLKQTSQQQTVARELAPAETRSGPRRAGLLRSPAGASSLATSRD
ncbi:hypothetical protein C7A10_20665 [Pseudomonas fluorescens]|uniref:Uncharacterized protein n=1 Tax=Pseudomonas fluorescens TaxID=294 RepID=A0A2T0I246_PSEFL|nr:hypothetical protein C7A10_20665 [Pseudomonas fluorescens]